KPSASSAFSAECRLFVARVGALMYGCVCLCQRPLNDELVWDNGTPFPEPCIDRLAPTIEKYESLAWLCGGLSFFASLGPLAVWNDKASKIPFMYLPCFIGTY
ncbi:hypothetical protein Taro_013757, partial [Colocasia esculenta]|nr:hypothetical protein [Colocasia esculenta]